MKLASGRRAGRRDAGGGDCVGLGTDGARQQQQPGPLLEMDTAAKLHKVDRLDPTVLDAQTVLRMATMDGARALGMEGRTGSLEPGKRADLIVVNTRRPHMVPMHHPVSQLVYAARGSDVETVVINGRLVVQGGRILTFDVEAAMDAVNRFAHRARERR